jgi:hypothetical protein
MAKRTRPAGARAAIAGPTIRQLVAAYAAGLPATRRGRAAFGLELLENHLNGYAYQSLDGAEQRSFERLSNAEGAAHREYCEIFGPDKIVPELRHFLGWFLIRKVMAQPADLRRVAQETRGFIEWLGKHGHVTAQAAKDGAALAAEAARVLPAAEQVAHLLRPRLDAPEPSGDVIEGQFRVARLAPGKLWLESWEDGKTYGPLAVPAAVTQRLRVDWEMSGTVGKAGRAWQVLEVWNVYPAVG